MVGGHALGWIAAAFVAAALIMGGLLWLATTAVGLQMHGLWQAAALLGLIAGAIAVYALFLALFAVTNWREAADAFRPPPSRDLRM